MVDLFSPPAVRLAPVANTDVGGVDPPGVAEGMGSRVLKPPCLSPVACGGIPRHCQTDTTQVYVQRRL